LAPKIRNRPPLSSGGRTGGELRLEDADASAGASAAPFYHRATEAQRTTEPRPSPPEFTTKDTKKTTTKQLVVDSDACRGLSR
jgi:hypothetical protein